LSAGDAVRLSVTKSRYGLIPNFVGSSLEAAGAEVRRLKLDVRVTSRPGPMGTILRQSLDPGVATAPGLVLKLVVGDGSQRESS
jgi:beta-lactam-binding protein with PASTA domain